MATTAELDAQRLAYLDHTVFKGVREFFKIHPQLQSATVMVAQYWNDEATDAVHTEVIVSVLQTPDLDAFFASQGYDDASNDYLKDATNTPFEYDGFDLYMKTRWDSNGVAVPLFAAFCTASGSQENSVEENFRPYCILRRNDAALGGLSVQIVGQMLRPQLDGLTTEEEW